MMADRRDLLLMAGAAGALLAAAPAFAQNEAKPPPVQTGRVARTTRLFKAPGLFPNALAVAPDGLWIGQQKSSHQPGPEAAWLVDWTGKLLKTFTHEAANTSGMAYGDGHVYAMGNGGDLAHQGAYEIDMRGNVVQRPMPLGGGGSHGAQWHDGKIWLVDNRLRIMLRVDPQSWLPDFALPIALNGPDTNRWHDMTFDDQGFIWMVTGNDSTSPENARAGLAKYDPESGRLLERVMFAPGTGDPHGLVFHDGRLVASDAGSHPGWQDMASPDAGWIFSIEIA